MHALSMQYTSLRCSMQTMCPERQPHGTTSRQCSSTPNTEIKPVLQLVLVACSVMFGGRLCLHCIAITELSLLQWLPVGVFLTSTGPTLLCLCNLLVMRFPAW